MTVQELLSQLDGVRHTTRGWTAKCPAHDDRRPSLSIRETDTSQILVYCFAGCSVEAICAALGLTVRDLFANSEPPSRRRRRGQVRPWRFAWRETAAKLEDHVPLLKCRAQAVLESAQGLDTSAWTDEDFDAAVKAVSWAYMDIERSKFLKDFAFHLRLEGLKKEQEQYASRSRVA